VVDFGRAAVIAVVCSDDVAGDNFRDDDRNGTLDT
jgi:hypothetical protein